MTYGVPAVSARPPTRFYDFADCFLVKIIMIVEQRSAKSASAALLCKIIPFQAADCYNIITKDERTAPEIPDNESPELLFHEKSCG